MNIEIYDVDFLLEENEDSRREVYPFILYISTEDSFITIFLEQKEYDKLKKEVL